MIARLFCRLRLLVMTTVLILFSLSAFAYTDDIQGATVDDAWQAALKALGPKGVKEADEKKKVLVSRWMEDEVVRRNSLFKGVTSQSYRRRSQMEISLTEIPDGVHILIKGEFEEKPQDSPAQAPWRKLKMQTEDYDLERNLFMRILTQMAKDRYRPA